MKDSRVDQVRAVWLLLREGNFDGIEQYVAPDVELHAPEGVKHGYDGLREFIAARRSAPTRVRMLDVSDVDDRHVLARVEVGFESPAGELTHKLAQVYSFGDDGRLVDWRFFVNGRREALAWIEERGAGTVAADPAGDVAP